MEDCSFFDFSPHTNREIGTVLKSLFENKKGKKGPSPNPLERKRFMKEKLEEIKTKGLEKIKNVKTIAELEEVRKELTGKKSELSEVLKSMKDLSVEEKKTIGMMATEIKNTFLSNLQEKEEEIIASMSVLNQST